MKTIWIKVAMGAVGVSWLVGCGGGAQYTIVSRAQPQAFAAPGCHAVVEPVRADHLMVGDQTEAQFLAKKQPNQVWAFNRDKRESEGELVTKLEKKHVNVFAPGAPANTFVIRPTWTRWEPGKYMGMFSTPGEGTFVFDVISPTGQTLDRISIKPSATAYTAQERMHSVFKDAGKGVSRYIEENWTCASR